MVPGFRDARHRALPATVGLEQTPEGGPGRRPPHQQPQHGAGLAPLLDGTGRRVSRPVDVLLAGATGSGKSAGYIRHHITALYQDGENDDRVVCFGQIDQCRNELQVKVTSCDIP